MNNWKRLTKYLPHAVGAIICYNLGRRIGSDMENEMFAQELSNLNKNCLLVDGKRIIGSKYEFISERRQLADDDFALIARNSDCKDGLSARLAIENLQ